MTKNIKWNTTIYVENGPTFAYDDAISSEAVDILNFQVAKGTTSEVNVDVQPGSLDALNFLYIKCDGPPEVKYKFNDGTSDGKVLVLDRDHLITSTEIIKLFEKAPKLIKFTNSNTEKDANIKIVVGRKATH